MRKLGKQTLIPQRPICISETASVVGEKEAHGPLGKCFDLVCTDPYFGQSTWEKAETEMLHRCFDRLLNKSGNHLKDIDAIFAGDLLNQCISTAFAFKDTNIPYFGLYGACSTMVLSSMLASISIESGAYKKVCAETGSHFCTAERQYRFPLEYGGQRTPTSQWTVTGCGAALIEAAEGEIMLKAITPGVIFDSGIKDANNMGAAMAPAAYSTIRNHLADIGQDADYYDAIFTGDLGAIGHDMLEAMFRSDGIELGARYMDCGVLIYDAATQDVHAGGSGCGCCASVLCGHIIPAMRRGVWKRVLVAATGALMNPLSCQQGGSIPGISHAISLEVC